MKLVSALIASAFAVTAFAAEPTKTEAVVKPAAVAGAPATPKEMPKVAKPKTKAEKKAEAATGDATKSPSKDQKAEAPKK